MIRTLTFIGLLALGNDLYGQAIAYQWSENDSVKYLINNNGTFFRDYANETGAYHVPKNASTKILYAMNLQAIGMDVNGQLKGAMSNYDNSDFFPGPVASDYNAASYQTTYATALWPMQQDWINDHITHWQDVGYVAIPEILNWPGNGNTTNSEAATLAPFHDADNDGLYEPMNGDYPVIRGNVAVFSIVNDGAGAHSSALLTGNLEIHLMFYQYNGISSAVNNTTFINTTLFNRGTATLNDFHFGALADFDIGTFSDDYPGTMIDRNLAYTSNADLYDEPANGNTGYGINPPAAGIMSLNHDLYSHMAVNSVSPQGFFPTTAIQYYTILKGFNVDGSIVYDDNSEATRYIYYGDSTGWNAYNESVPPGDYKSIFSMSPETFAPGEQLCYDLAIVFARSNGSTVFSPLGALAETAGVVQEFYDNQQFICASGVTGVSTEYQQYLNVYPNPATNLLNIDGLSQPTAFSIVSADGKTILQEKTAGTIDIGTLQNGYYLLKMEGGQIISFVKE